MCVSFSTECGTIASFGMRIRTIFQYLSTFIVLALFPSCGSETLTSTWTATPPVIDGDLGEWRALSSVALGDSHMDVSIQNDAENLYLACRMTDAQARRMFERSGLTLWLDPENHQRKQLEIRFPASRYINSSEDRGGFWSILTDTQREKAQRSIEDMRKGVLVIDQKSVGSRLFPGSASDTIAFASSGDRDPFCVEARIPLHVEKLFPLQKPIEGKFSLGVRMEKPVNARDQRRSFPIGFGRQMGGERGGATGERGGVTYNDVWVEVVAAHHE